MAGYIGSRTNNALVSLSGATGTISDDVVFPGKIIKNIYVDSNPQDTTITNSTTNKRVYRVTIPTPQTSYSYLIIGGIGGYLDYGSEMVKCSLIKDHDTSGETYIEDTLITYYQNSLSYNDHSFFLSLNYYYEPSTNTSFTIDATIRSDGGQTYRAPWNIQKPFVVYELGGN